MNTYVIEVINYIGVKANNIDEALYKYHEGYIDGKAEEEITDVYKDNDFLSDIE